MQQAPISQKRGQCLEPRQRIAQVMKHSHRVDVVERSLSLKVEKTALFLTQDIDLLGASRPSQPLPGHRERSGADVDSKNLGAGIQMTEVIGADTGPASRIEDPHRNGAIGALGHSSKNSGQDAVMAPTPVVSRWRTILKWVSWIGTPVIEIAHHGCGGIRRRGLHGAADSRGWDGSGAFHGRPLRGACRSNPCKHLFMLARDDSARAVTCPNPACSRS